MECLFNTNSNNVVAYCKHHHCGMTVKQMKCKNCLGKNCWYLQKNEEHDYWRQREAIKQKKKAKKQAVNEYLKSIENQTGGIYV